MKDEFEKAFEGTTEKRSSLRIAYILAVIIVSDLHSR